MSQLQRYVTEWGAMVFPLGQVTVNITLASGPVLYLASAVDAARAAEKAEITDLRGDIINKDAEIARLKAQVADLQVEVDALNAEISDPDFHSCGD